MAVSLLGNEIQTIQALPAWLMGHSVKQFSKPYETKSVCVSRPKPKHNFHLFLPSLQGKSPKRWNIGKISGEDGDLDPLMVYP